MAKVFIGMPVYNSVPAPCIGKLVSLFLKSAKQFNALVDIVDSVGVDLARNMIIEHFLSTDATHLLFLDSDMLVPNNLVERLLSHEKEMVSALYFGRTMPHAMFKVSKNGASEWPESFPKNSLLKAESVGLGACLIKRNVIEKASELAGENNAMFKFEFTSRTSIIGEDSFFCGLVKKAGFKIFVDTGLEIKHFGGFIDQKYYQ